MPNIPVVQQSMLGHIKSRGPWLYQGPKALRPLKGLSLTYQPERNSREYVQAAARNELALRSTLHSSRSEQGTAPRRWLTVLGPWGKEKLGFTVLGLSHT
jgi:hypothetical protein